MTVKEVVTKDEAKRLVVKRKDNMVHVFNNIPELGLIGSDYSKKRVFKLIDESDKIEITGEQAQKLGHGLAIFAKNIKFHRDIIFVETKEI